MTSILVVEDDLTVRGLVRRLLVAEGYDVQEAANGKTAVTLYRVHPTDVVETDLLMPEMEGLELIRELRRLNPRAGIVAMTGADPKAANTYLKMASAFGALQILHKPFTKEELLATIAKVME